MADEQYHQLHPDLFHTTHTRAVHNYTADATAADGIPPEWTPGIEAAFRKAVQDVWNDGYRTALADLAAEGDR